MEMIGAYEAKTHLAKLLERVERREHLDDYPAWQARGPVGSCDL